MKIHLERAHKIWILVSLLILIIIISSITPNSKAAEKVPDFTVDTSDGENFTLSEQDKPIVIEFMTPICSECKKAEENLKNLYPEYNDDFIFLSVDISESSIEKLKQFKKEREVPWKVGQGDAELFQEYGGSLVPKIVIIDSERFLTYEKTDVAGEEELKKEMDKVIGGTSEREELQQFGIYGLAVVGGISSFFSPCSFPLLSSYIAYYVRPNDEEKNENKAFEGTKMGIKASLGIVLVFGVVGSLLVVGGQWLSDFIPYLQLIIGIAISFLGFFVLADKDIRTFLPNINNVFSDKLNFKNKSDEKNSSPFYYGVGYGAASAGCTAPVFSAILLASWLSEGVFQTILVLLLYLATMIVLMVSFSLFTVFFREGVVKNFNKVIGPIKRISGFVLVGAGIYLVYSFFL